ncbi:DUF3667 domain-containing protein [Erythrobacter sp. F6033]|uniref:DUF3667 domain-containing protein n=1 Tax=Erythrobacter sp. F6033 TaxID=2926401 RepID=UPI001FF6D046|nr:DUF3667 domain-containing protein [Erythrobacter sp. F6033]MCK0127215.1 DUF3667 domain-containing protein [Erythrobacter sp. F6033]
MSDITEGIGAAIEGALTGRAVEPNHGEGAAADESGSRSCLNCGAQPAGSFCQNCGQKTHVHRTLSAIGHDLIHGVLHLDGKFWRTIPLLVFKPGKLTRRYIEGERAKFVSPMAMFLFSVFAMFAVFQALGITTPTDIEGEAKGQLEQLAKDEQARLTTEAEAINERLANPELTAVERSELEQALSDVEDKLGQAENGEAIISNWLESGGSDTLDEIQAATSVQIEEARGRLATLPQGSEEYDELAAEIAILERGSNGLQTIQTGPVQSFTLDEEGNVKGTFEKSGIPFIDKLLEKWSTNPSLMLYKMQNNAYKFSWLLIPLSVPFVWLIFAWKRRFKAYDHAIFVTYSLGFMSLLFIAVSILGSIGVPTGILVIAGMLIPPLHLYKQLRGTYEIRRFSSFWRLIALTFFIAIVIGLFMQALLLLGAF